MPKLAARFRIRDRYEVQSALREEADAQTHLCKDRGDGDRLVVVRSQTPPSAARDPEHWLNQALQRARLASKACHPSLVSIQDLWLDEGQLWIVWPKVTGNRLDQLVRRQGPRDPVWAMRLSITLAQALEDLHDAGAMHERVRTSNIIVDESGHPCLLDLGLAVTVHPPLVRRRPDKERTEPSQGAYVVPWADLVGLASVVYEQLCGKPVRARRDAYLRQLPVNGAEFVPIGPLADVNVGELNQLLCQAFQAGQDGGLDDVATLVSRLQAILNTEPAAARSRGDDPIERVLDRIRRSRDFPALSETIAAVNRSADSDQEPISVLCSGILRDYGLTTRLLRLVNSSQLRQFGGDIQNITRAVNIVGVNTVRNLAVSLMLFDHLQGRANLASLKDEIAGAYYSGLLAREMHHHAGIRSGEDAFVCALFQRFGYLLIKFHLPDEAEQIATLVREEGIDEQAAAKRVLELDPEELGLKVAREWNLSEDVCSCMAPVRNPRRERPGTERERLRHLATLSNLLADEIKANEPQQHAAVIENLHKRFGAAVGVSGEQLLGCVNEATRDLVSDAKMLGYSAVCASFAQLAAQWSDGNGIGGADIEEIADTQALAACHPDEVVRPSHAQPESAAGEATQPGLVRHDSDPPGFSSLVQPLGENPAPEPLAALVPPGDDAVAPKPEEQGGPVQSDPSVAEAASACEAADGLRDAADSGTQATPVAETDPRAVAAVDRSRQDSSIRQAKLAQGLREIVDMLVEERDLAQILQAILQGMLDGVGFQRVLLFIREPRTGVLRCRMGAGESAAAIVSSGLCIPSDPQTRDLFYPAAQMGADLCLTDLDEPRLRPHVPAWYRERIGARGLILLPLVIKTRTFGLIYADVSDVSLLDFSGEEHAMLKSLRNQALMALRQGGSIR